MEQLEADRRQDPRIELHRPCKVFDPRGDRYIAGTTWNLSSRGMMLALPRPIRFELGERVFIGLALRRRDVLLARDEMVEATVVRWALTASDQTVIAVELDHAIELRPELVAVARAA